MIKFYKVNDQYGCFSNFSKHSFIIDGVLYKTAEHYFQSKKFEGTKFEKEIILAQTPMIAAKMGRDKNKPLRENWEYIKDKIMYEAVIAKFKANEDIKNTLILTKEELIVEATSNDYYWGEGSLGTGKNMLGKILMEVRDTLKREE